MKTRREQLAEQAAMLRYVFEGQPAREWYGTWWPKRGSICADGSIVGAYKRGQPVPLVRSGVAYLPKRRLAAAERLGWKRRGTLLYGRDLVMVERV